MIKKTLLVSFLLGGTTYLAHAQDTRIGLKAGASLTNLEGKDAEFNGNKFGFHGGLTANIGLNDAFSIQPELLYSQKGSKYTLNGTEFSRKLNYIDLPIMVRVNANGLFFEGGPQLGFLVASKYDAGSVSYDTKDVYNNFDFGYAAGLGYQSASGPGIGLRYNGGITDIGKKATVGNVTYQPQIHNSAFQLYLSYVLGSSGSSRRR